jgi:hypothetical protein
MIYPLSRVIMRESRSSESLRDVLPNLETFRLSVAGKRIGLASFEWDLLLDVCGRV